MPYFIGILIDDWLKMTPWSYLGNKIIYFKFSKTCGRQLSEYLITFLWTKIAIFQHLNVPAMRGHLSWIGKPLCLLVTGFTALPNIVNNNMNYLSIFPYNTWNILAGFECNDLEGILDNLPGVTIANMTGRHVNDVIMFSCSTGYEHSSGDLVWFCRGEPLEWFGQEPICNGKLIKNLNWPVLIKTSANSTSVFAFCCVLDVQWNAMVILINNLNNKCIGFNL